MRYQSIPPMSEKDTARFWSKVDQSGGLDACWIWTAATTRNGYGTICLSGSGRKRMYVAHRVAYVMAHGEIPDDLVLDHLCRNRACVNPRHMETVTIRENVMRGEGVNAVAQREGICKRGHALTGHNVKHTKNGKITCRTCFNAACSASYRRNRDRINTRRRAKRQAA